MDKPLTLHPHELAAALAGTLRQVRRPVVPQPLCEEVPERCSEGDVWCGRYRLCGMDGEEIVKWDEFGPSPLGQPGDVIWGRETWASDLKHHTVAYKHDGKCGAWFGDGAGGRMFVEHGRILEAPGYPWGLETLTTYGLKCYGGHWRSPVTMPRWASRWSRTVAAVRVERTQSISTHDIGCCGINLENNNVGARNEYAINWNRHYARKGLAFEANPWAWVCELGGEA